MVVTRGYAIQVTEGDKTYLISPFESNPRLAADWVKDELLGDDISWNDFWKRFENVEIVEKEVTTRTSVLKEKDLSKYGIHFSKKP